MEYTTQGTVQVRLSTGATTVVLVSPVSDYKIRYKTMDYIVFVKETPFECRAFPLEKVYDVHDAGVAMALREAAFKGTKVELELKINGSDGIVIGIQIPATTR